ncbi:type-1 angiotensin II receptor-associated protein isoform X2 [Anthonomus grandis grandis]|uniref:type-1 angiotensin II receptor-associated protein isoform X2 n=1 Tax=Anthonomus grandis grandis TaxID=2921223 RepID=UPI002165E230|nr:type-1 angiotensin II receptor-associated protein isoform X2 [Anthonomus grandis grandis]
MPSLLQQIPNFNIKVVFFAHFMIMSMSSMGMWATNAYLFYNSIFIFLLLWSIFHSQLQEPLQLAILINGASIILDILLLIMQFPGNDQTKFSAAIAVLHLLVRPFTTFILIRNLEERGGNSGCISNMFAETRAESYEDIDRSAVPPSSTSAGYGFANAQPI